MSSRPSSSWSANQSQPTWSGPSALVLHSRSIHAEPSTVNARPPVCTCAGDGHPRQRVVVGGVARPGALSRKPALAVEHGRLPPRSVRSMRSRHRLPEDEAASPRGRRNLGAQSPSHTRRGRRAAPARSSAPRAQRSRARNRPASTSVSARCARYTSRAPQADRRGTIVGASASGRMSAGIRSAERPASPGRAEVPGPVPPLGTEARMGTVVRRKDEGPRHEGALEALGIRRPERLRQRKRCAEPGRGRASLVQSEREPSPAAISCHARRDTGEQSDARGAHGSCSSFLPEGGRGRRPCHPPGGIVPAASAARTASPTAWSRTSTG